MPSPSSITRPTSRTSMRDSKCSISCWMTEAISSALNFMGAPLVDILAEVPQLIGDRAVVDHVADPEHGAADQLRIGLLLQHRLTPQLGADVLHDLAGRLRADGGGGRKLDANAVAAAVPEDVRLAANGPQTIQPPVLRDDL